MMLSSLQQTAQSTAAAAHGLLDMSREDAEMTDVADDANEGDTMATAMVGAAAAAMALYKMRGQQRAAHY